MRSVSGEFSTSPWGEIPNWGRCVTVKAVDDIDQVHRLMDAAGDDRRAVLFERMTEAQRQILSDAIQATGLALRPFDDNDRDAATFRPSGIERLLMVPALPYVLMMRIRGRTTQMYEVTKTPSDELRTSTEAYGH